MSSCLLNAAPWLPRISVTANCFAGPQCNLHGDSSPLFNGQLLRRAAISPAAIT
jgi:hypothetical protein